MTEQPVAVAQKAAAGRDAMLSTKLHAPGPRPGFVPRPRLTERLDEALGRGVVLVCAPAGYGKTALLAGWAQHFQRPVAWLSLDAGDNDPARFWRHAVAALDQVCPGLGERIGPLLGPPAPPSFEGLVTALINELAARPGAGVMPLVLDDYHLVAAQSVHASLGFLLEHLPPGLHPVLASRADPPLALARLRARGQLAELRDAELRFTAGEAADVLRETAAVNQDRIGSVIEAGALRALALAADGEDADALAGLAGALTLACPQGYVRVFADEGAPMAALLGQLIASRTAMPPPRSRSPSWRGSSARLAPRTPRQIPGQARPWRSLASSSR